LARPGLPPNRQQDPLKDHGQRPAMADDPRQELCCASVTLLAAAGEPDIVGKLKRDHKAGNKTFRVHIDGFNLLPFLKGEAKENAARLTATAR
jgi:hypothetical protein